MSENKITINLTEKQYLDLVKLVYLGNMVAEEVCEDKDLGDYADLQQFLYSHSGPGKGNLYIAHDKADNEYFLAEDLEEDLSDLLDDYDESRFWESLVMRLTLRDLQKKFSEKELAEIPEEAGRKEMEVIHNYYISEFDDHDLDNLKIVSMKKI